MEWLCSVASSVTPTHTNTHTHTHCKGSTSNRWYLFMPCSYIHSIHLHLKSAPRYRRICHMFTCIFSKTEKKISSINSFLRDKQGHLYKEVGWLKVKEDAFGHGAAKIFICASCRYPLKTQSHIYVHRKYNVINRACS